MLHACRIRVFHELRTCRAHTPQFWSRVERAMPDFAARKRWLLENAVGLIDLL